MIIRTRAYGRAGLIGNPSDGFYGKTVAIIIRNFHAEVTLYESPRLQIVPSENDLSNFASVEDLVTDVKMHGYYGGVRLLKAAIKRFFEYCRQRNIELPNRNFTVCYSSNIPRLVGLGGSSAIITAAIRAMMEFYEVEIPKEIQPTLILTVESEELGIPAGLQDRVAQVYEGVTYMDFRRDLLEADGRGHYEAIDPRLLPPLYVAYAADQAEPTERPHGTVRVLYDRGDQKVIRVMNKIASLAVDARQCLLDREPERLGTLIDRNFDLRSSIFTLNAAHRTMVDSARAIGATAKFAGSGGAIIGTYESPHMLAQLRERLEAIGCDVIQPEVS